jgi:hypothetical protein
MNPSKNPPIVVIGMSSIGNNSFADKTSVAVGENSNATNGAVAIGKDANATNGAVVIRGPFISRGIVSFNPSSVNAPPPYVSSSSNSFADKTSVAIGENSNATNGSIALGKDTNATNGAVVINGPFISQRNPSSTRSDDPLGLC